MTASPDVHSFELASLASHVYRHITSLYAFWLLVLVVLTSLLVDQQFSLALCFCPAMYPA